MSFYSLTDATYSRQNYNFPSISTEDDWDAETSPLIPKTDTEIKTTTGQKIVTWVKDHKEMTRITLNIITVFGGAILNLVAFLSLLPLSPVLAPVAAGVLMLVITGAIFVAIVQIEKKIDSL